MFHSTPSKNSGKAKNRPEGEVLNVYLIKIILSSSVPVSSQKSAISPLVSVFIRIM